MFARVGAPAFDLRFNFLGGGDTDFFYVAARLACRFHWVAEAVITETVPHNRTNLSWLVARGLRIGAINYHVAAQGGADGLVADQACGSRCLAALPLSLPTPCRLS